MKYLSYVYLIIILATSWIPLVAQTEIAWDSLNFHAPTIIRYDTIEGDFLFENLISAYIDADAVVKSGSFIKEGIINKELYNKGIITYLTYDFGYKSLINKNPQVHYDSASLFTFLNEMYYIALRDRTYLSETEINPFCGQYYKKYYMKVEVLYMGLVNQRLPLFMTCDEAENYEDIHYTHSALPTYLITKVFTLTEH